MEKSGLSMHERFGEVAERVLEKVYSAWAARLKFVDVLVTWPARPVVADDGTYIDNHCILPLPGDDRDAAIRAMVLRTDARALLLLERRQDDVFLLLETPAGTKSWKVPIRRHGDVYSLGSPTVKTDVERIGLLYTKSRA